MRNVFTKKPDVVQEVDVFAPVAPGELMPRPADLLAHPPMHTPHIELKLHWHRNFQRDPKSKWLRDMVATLFTDESDEWRT